MSTAAPTPENLTREDFFRLMQEQHNQMAALEAELATIRQAQANHPPADNPPAVAPAYVPSFKPKVNVPDKFDGTRKKLTEFLTTLDIYLGLRASDFRTESDKLLFSASYLSGRAFDWIQPQLATYQQNLRSGLTTTTGPFVSYDAFVQELKSTFGDIDEVATAERDIKHLRQTTSASVYSAEFMRITSHLNWNNDSLVAIYYSGLKDTIKDYLMVHGRPSLLQDLITLSVQIDNRLFERQREKRSNNILNSRPQYVPRTAAPAGDPMDIDAVSVKRPTNPSPSSAPGSGQRGPLTDQERQFRRSNNLCLYCGKPGHNVSGCAALKQRPRAHNASAAHLDSSSQEESKNTLV